MRRDLLFALAYVKLFEIVASILNRTCKSQGFCQPSPIVRIIKSKEYREHASTVCTCKRKIQARLIALPGSLWIRRAG
jgi:hypothetical protein